MNIPEFYTKPFKLQRFQDFLRNFLPEDYTPSQTLISKQSTKSGKLVRFDQVGFSASLDLPVFTGSYKDETVSKQSDPQVSITRESFRYLKDLGVSEALVAFYSPQSKIWRLSYIFIEYKLEGSKLITELAHPRRFSFLLGKSAKVRTPWEFLEKKGRVQNIEDLRERFRPEVLNRQFYLELRNWYWWALKSSSFPQTISQSKGGKNLAVIRLLTRLVFIWFLKQKHLIPEKLFDFSNLKDILADLDPDLSTYYKAILQNLFFATLNTPLASREVSPDSDSSSAYLYSGLFTSNDPGEILQLFAGIPFLNGGLFECLDQTDSTSPNWIDGFTERDINLVVPNRLFNSPASTVDLSQYIRGGREAKVRGLINILNDYHFTVSESTPIDQDIALDPELLGNIFENLLASYNPETSETARKESGSFYTPSYIVNYMVDAGLKSYFQSRLNLTGDPTSKFDSLFSWEDEQNPFDPENTKNLVEAIAKLKSMDPACGSGAFLMGLLNKLVLILNKLDPQGKLWEQAQENLLAQKLNQNSDLSQSSKQHLAAKLQSSFASPSSNYGRKLYLIENSIFGVDIQPFAIQIAKLRFFISLVIDQRKTKNNQIIPLPNLETKFVAADTLLKIKSDQQMAFTFNTQLSTLEAKLRKLRRQLFNAHTPADKARLRQQDQKVRQQILNQLQSGNNLPEHLQKLKTWNPHQPNSSAEFFDPDWMFGLNSKFDLIIGNPPYVQLQKNSGKLSKRYKPMDYQTFTSTGDIYQLFFERGVQLLNQGGHLIYITSNKWMRAKYGKKMRKFFGNKVTCKQLINFAGHQIFSSATVDTCILLLQNKKPAPNNYLQGVKVDSTFKASEKAQQYFRQNTVQITNPGAATWYIGTPMEMQIKRKIEEQGTPLKDWDIKIYRGVLTGYNKAFIIDQQKRDELIAQDPKSKEIIKPLLRGRDIKRYHANFAEKYLIATLPAKNIDIEEYPAIKQYLKTFGKRLNQTGEYYIDENGKKRKSRKKTGHKWFETQDSISYWKQLEKEKIVWKRIGSKIRFSYDQDKMYCLDSTVFIGGKFNLFLTGVLNSKLSHYQLFMNSPKTGTGDLIISVQALTPLRVPKIDEDNKIKREIEKITEKIKKTKAQNPTKTTKPLETQINHLVYKLYNLTKKEITQIETKQK